MKTTTKKRVYEKLRHLVEQQDGTMTYDGRGLHGAWVIILGSKRGRFPAMGARTFPKLDSLYVPAVADPKTWDDYLDELVPDADKKLYDLLDDVA